jgi:hypothetical protein
MTILRTMKPAMSPRTTQEDGDILISGGRVSGERQPSGEDLATGFAAYFRIATRSVRRRTWALVEQARHHQDQDACNQWHQWSD